MLRSRLPTRGEGFVLAALLSALVLSSCQGDVADFVDKGIGYDLSIATEGGSGTGTVQYAAARNTLSWGTVVTLVPTPSATSFFEGWSGSNGGEVYRDGWGWKLLMDGDKAIVAVFGPGSPIAVPSITVSGSGFTRTVSMVAPSPGATIRYTTDGTTPTTSSTVYSSPITVSGYYVTKTISAVAFLSGSRSSVTSVTFSITPSVPVPANPGIMVTTLAGSASAGSSDGYGTAATFNHPEGIATDGSELYVADTDNHKIRKISIATGAVTTLAGSGSAGFGDGTGAAASFNYPFDATTDGVYVYVGDTWNHRIRKIALSTAVVTTLAGSGGIGSLDGPAASAGFAYLNMIATDGTAIYVADSNSNMIRKIE